LISARFSSFPCLLHAPPPWVFVVWPSQ
jgi:hypothetical protein